MKSLIVLYIIEFGGENFISFDILTDSDISHRVPTAFEVIHCRKSERREHSCRIEHSYSNGIFARLHVCPDSYLFFDLINFSRFPVAMGCSIIIIPGIHVEILGEANVVFQTACLVCVSIREISTGQS